MLIRCLKQAAALAPLPFNHPGVAANIAGALSRGSLDKAKRMARAAARTPNLGAEKMISLKYRYLGNPAWCGRG